MSDTYQATYDAVRSVITNGDIGSAVERAIDLSEIIYHVQQSQDYFTATLDIIEREIKRSCYLMRPKLSIDGNRWCALYGDNLQDGVAGFGGSPAEALDDFDIQMTKGLNKDNTVEIFPGTKDAIKNLCDVQKT